VVTELKNTITKLENNLDRFNNRLDEAEERFNQFRDKAVGHTQSDKQKEKRKQLCEDS